MIDELRFRAAGARSSIDPWALIALPVTVVIAWLFVNRPMLVQLLALVVLLMPLLISAWARVLFVVVGTLTIFGPAELNPPKLIFLLGTAIAFSGSFAHIRSKAGTPGYEALKPLLKASFALLFLIALSLPVAEHNGVLTKEWLRDAAPYGLLACAPLFAFDAQAAFGVRSLRRLIALVGLGGASAFMVSWYFGRGLTQSISGSFGLATFMLGAALFAFALAMALEAPEARFRWLALGSLVFAMIASTGSRSAAAFLAAPFGILIGSRRHLASRSLRLLVLIPIAALLVGLTGYSLVRAFNADTTVYSERIQLLLQPGGSSDQSYRERRLQTEAAWDLFRSAPVLGVGPGHLITGKAANGGEFSSPNVDSPAGFLVDYGLVGLLVVTAAAVWFGATVRRLRIRAGLRTPGQLALIGFGGVIVARAVLQVPFEDKGLAIGLMLLLAIATREAVDAARRGGAPPLLPAAAHRR